MEVIGGQVWQDRAAYDAFMARENVKTECSISKEELLERDLQRLVKAIKDGEKHFEMTLRAGERMLIKPGESLLVPTGISTALLDDYNHTVELIATLNSNSWLRVSPYLVSKTGLSYLDLKNFAQLVIARNEQLRYFLRETLRDDSSVYVQNVKDIDETSGSHHVAYAIDTGEELATLKISKR